MPIQRKFPTSIIAFTVLIAVAVFALSIVSAVALEFRKDYPPRNPNVASVLYVLSPNVFLTPGGSSVEQAVKGTVKLDSGSSVRTADSGSAVLVYPNGTITTLEGDTSVTVDELDSTGNRSRLSLLAGTMWSRVDRVLDTGDYYEVRSAGVVSSVRGTSFEMSADESGVSVTVLSDIVSVARDPQQATTTDKFTQAAVSAGERIRIGEDETGAVTSASEVIGEDEFVEKIKKQESVEQAVQASEILLELQNLPLPEAGVGPDSVFYPVERLTEALAAMAERNPDAKAQRLLGQAAERLSEAREGEGSSVGDSLDTYEDLVSMALLENSESKTAETRSVVANATLAHIDVLKNILSTIPEEARPFVTKTIAISEQGHIEAVEQLAKRDPEKGFKEGLRAQKRFLENAQKSAVKGDSIDTYEALRLYDRMTQTLNNVSEGSPELLERHSDSLTRSLRTIETLETVEDKLLPGMAVTVDEARERSINSQLSTIAEMVVADPNRAAAAYDKAAKEYAKDIEKDAKDVEKKGEKEPRESLDRKGQAYRVYENFGSEVSFVAKNLRTGTTTVAEQVDKATEQHTSILETVVKQVPPPAKAQVEQVLKEIEEEKKERPKEDQPKTPAELVEQKKSERPVGDLPQPQSMESGKSSDNLKTNHSESSGALVPADQSEKEEIKKKKDEKKKDEKKQIEVAPASQQQKNENTTQSNQSSSQSSGNSGQSAPAAPPPQNQITPAAQNNSGDDEEKKKDESGSKDDKSSDSRGGSAGAED